MGYLVLELAGLWVGPDLSVVMQAFGRVSLISIPWGWEFSGGPVLMSLTLDVLA